MYRLHVTLPSGRHLTLYRATRAGAEQCRVLFAPDVPIWVDFNPRLTPEPEDLAYELLGLAMWPPAIPEPATVPA